MAYSGTKSRLRELEIRPSRQLGQNFITEGQVLDSILQFGNPPAAGHVVEVGPGLGALTGKLAERCEKLTVVEIEQNFCADLGKKYPAVKVLNADVRTVDFSTIGNELTVFGNLPYSFSTEIVFHLIENRHSIKRAVLMLQREFAGRMAASPGGRDYGTLSVGCQLWCRTRLGPVISGDSFYPPTEVDSILIELTFLDAPSVAVENLEWFRRVVKASFVQRRRMLANSLRSSGLFSAEKVDQVLKECAIDGRRRAETLSLEEFSRLASALAR